MGFIGKPASRPSLAPLAAIFSHCPATPTHSKIRTSCALKSIVQPHSEGQSRASSAQHNVASDVQYYNQSGRCICLCVMRVCAYT